MKTSLWTNTTNLPSFNKLDDDKKTDVVVVGGGICGILCAYFLKQANIDCILVEKQKIAQGTTACTTAKITSQHGLIYSYLIKKYGKEFSQKYLGINQYAIDVYEQLCKNISCDFKRASAYTYSIQNRDKIEQEVDALKSLGMPAELKEDLPLPIEIAASVCMDNQAQFDPLKFIKHISNGLTIYEETDVYEITPKYAVCKNGKIYADKFIVATHFPFINRHGNYFLKLYQYRSYVIALENAQQLNGMYVDESETGLSFRSSNNLLLLGGGGGRTGKPCGNWTELIDFKNNYYPESKIIYKWATQDCMSLDKVPYIGQYSPKTPNLYVATGFNKWGMTSSMVAALILCDMIQDKKNDYSEIFLPSRNIIKPQLFVNGFETLTNFVYPTRKRCSHLGCALKWNKAEHTWDCSCHGSRFDKNGNLINNPATKDTNI